MFLVKAQITRKGINLPSSFFVNYVRASVRNSLQYFIWLKIKTVKVYSIAKSVKFLLALSILSRNVFGCQKSIDNVF